MNQEQPRDSSIRSSPTYRSFLHNGLVSLNIFTHPKAQSSSNTSTLMLSLKTFWSTNTFTSHQSTTDRSNVLTLPIILLSMYSLLSVTHTSSLLIARRTRRPRIESVVELSAANFALRSIITHWAPQCLRSLTTWADCGRMPFPSYPCIVHCTSLLRVC